MKIAVRFPVKNCPELILLCAGLHLIVAILALVTQMNWWLICVTIIAVIISWLVTLKQYTAVTSSSGDLCWTGESWLIAKEAESNSVEYIELNPTSWITSHYCLLKFNCGGYEKTWLFTNKHLGERAYRELCFLLKQDSHLTTKSQL